MDPKGKGKTEKEITEELSREWGYSKGKYAGASHNATNAAVRDNEYDFPDRNGGPDREVKDDVDGEPE